jgi:diamine N-acetyltransferase
VPGALVRIDQSNWRDALKVRVADEQLALVADYQPIALVILAKAYVQPGGRLWEPLAYAADGAIVAVVALAHTDDVTEVVNLAVDIERQRSGVGTEVMHAVLAWSKERGSKSVELTVNPANEIAIRLYQRVGFSPTGSVRESEPVWSMSLTGPSTAN